MIRGTTENKLDRVRTHLINEPFMVGYPGINGAVVTGIDPPIVGQTVVDSIITYIVDGITYQTRYSSLGDVGAKTTYETNLTGNHFDNYFYFKEEYNFGLTEQPKVDNQIFIDRNPLSVFEPQTRLGEINNMTQLEEYKNGYYKIKKEI